MDNLASRESREEIFSVIKGIIAEMIGEDVVKIVGVKRESQFVRHLKMDSIQIVKLAERINELYGDRVDFNEWMSKQPFLKLVRLSVGDVADFIASSLG